MQGQVDGFHARAAGEQLEYCDTDLDEHGVRYCPER